MPHRPRTLTAAALLVALLGVAALAYGLFLAAETIFGRPHDRTTALAVTVICLAAGAGILRVAKGLHDTDRWSRSPAVLANLFALPVAVSLVQSHQPHWGWPLGAVAATSLILLLTPTTAQALYTDPDDHN